MITVRYFASSRESLGVEQESLELPGHVGTVAGVIDHLVAVHGRAWAKVLREDKVLVAVNQTMSRRSEAVREGDEVAFFPPVTGG